MGVSQKTLWWEECDLSNLLLVETVDTTEFSKDTDTYGFLCVLPRKARTPLACAEKITQRSKVTIKRALYPFCSMQADQSPVKILCLLRYAIWGRNKEKQ